MPYKPISPAVLIPRAFSSVGSTRATWEELTTCCDLCGLSCEPPQSRTSPGNCENNTKSVGADTHFWSGLHSFSFFGYFFGLRSVSEVKKCPRNTDGWSGLDGFLRECRALGFFYWSENKGKVLTAKKISWKEIGDAQIQRESLGPQGCDNHG